MKRIALLLLTIISLANAFNPFVYTSERAIESVGKCTIARDTTISDFRDIRFDCENGNINLTIRDADRIARIHISYKKKSNTKHFNVSNDVLSSKEGSSWNTWEYDEFGIRIKNQRGAMKIAQFDIDDLWEKIKRTALKN